MEERKAKRDFIFIDESGDPGEATDYYIQGLIHITDQSLKKLNVHLGAFRYFGNIRNEMKSTKLNDLQKGHLLSVLKSLIGNNDFIKASAVYVDKKDYKGNYLFEKPDRAKDASKFRHFIIRRLLEFHFRETAPQTNEIELVFDRFHSLEGQEQQMRNYLRDERFQRLPKFLHISQADSKYVEMLQIADWISGSVKEKIFVHPERSYDELFSYIKTTKIVI